MQVKRGSTWTSSRVDRGGLPEDSQPKRRISHASAVIPAYHLPVFIRRLRIRGFRGIADLAWFPEPGINCLVGPGDSGKSTVLAAIALLLSPAPGYSLSEAFRLEVRYNKPSN
jgi:hypothetical protein